MIEALKRGELPPSTEVVEWMEPDKAGEKPTAKIGVFTSTEKFSFVSVYTGQKTEIPHVEAQRESSQTLDDGRIKTIFAFRFPHVLSNEQWQLIKENKIDISLVTQSLSPGEFDTRLHRSLELSSRKLFQADRIYLKKIAKEGRAMLCSRMFGGG